MIRWFIRLALLAVLVPVTYVGAAAADVYFTSKTDETPGRSDAIVVMGAAQYNGVPSAVFKARLDRSRQLYDLEVAPLIVVLGGRKEGDRFTEAQAGAAYLEKNLPANKVTGVKAGGTTLDSLRKFTGLARERRINKIVIVSDPLHLARAEEIAKDLGFEVFVSGSKIDESKDRRRSRLMKETLTLVYYRLFGEG